PPKNEVERSLQRMYEEILELTRVSVTDEFISLGGHSLRTVKLVNRIKKDLHKEITISEVMQYQTIREIAWQLERNTGTIQEPLKVAETKEYYEMSPAQQQIYISHMFSKDKLIYNIPQLYKLSSDIDVNRLCNSMENLVEKNEILRTTFHTKNGQFFQKIHPSIECCIEVREVNEIPEWLLELRKFDLSKGPLFRLTLYKYKQLQYLLIDIHHIISDGESVNLFLNQLNNIYSGVLNEQSIQYKDYSEWLNTYSYSREKEYWENELSGFSQKVFAGSKNKSINMNSIVKTLQLKDNIGEKIQKYIDGNKFNENSLFMAVFMTCLTEVYQENDIAVGVNVNGRGLIELENLIGMFVNTMPIRIELLESMNFKELAMNIQNKVIAGLDHQNYQFSDLVKDLDVSRNITNMPLIDTIFSFINTSRNCVSLGKTELLPQSLDVKNRKFNISFFIYKDENNYLINFEYNQNALKPHIADGLLSNFEKLVYRVLEDENYCFGDFKTINSQAIENTDM
ncbi:condensation domain-containing protein, partial [Listeria innocua]|uniref:condensation domain-containing protein n=3 Tax=Listeria TaxID=1637 RepID=UPI00162342C7